MKKIMLFIFLIAALSSYGQSHRYHMFDGIAFISGGTIYKSHLYSDRFVVNDTTYYGFPGFGTSHSTSAYGDHSHSGYELTISAGTTSQYWRGDKTWQTFPTIPAAQIQSDWNQSNNTSLDYIKNKPTISESLWSRVSGSTNNIYSLNTGNVGINTTSPGAKMDINGTVIIRNLPVLSGNADTVLRADPVTGVLSKQALGSCPVDGAPVNQSFTATSNQTTFTVTTFTANAYYMPYVDGVLQNRLVITRSGNVFTYAPGLDKGQVLLISN